MNKSDILMTNSPDDRNRESLSRELLPDSTLHFPHGIHIF